MDVAIRSTNGRFLDLVRSYLGDLRLGEKPARYVHFSADCGIERGLSGGREVRGKKKLYVNMLLVYDGRLEDEMAGRFLSMVRDMATNNANEFVRVRAVGVVLDNSAVLLPSPAPQAELATLAGLLVRAGAGYLGDEIVNIDPVLMRAYGVALPLLIPSPDIALFPELGREEPRRQTGPSGARVWRRPVPVAELGGRSVDWAPIGRVVFPRFEPGATTELQPLSRAEAVFAMSESLLNLHVWNERALLLIERLLRDVSVERLVVGSLPEAVDVLAGVNGGGERDGRTGR
jgi:hypothetical protein